MKNNKKLLMLAPLSVALISSALAGSFISTNNNTKTNSVLLRQEKTIEENQAQVTADFDNNGDGNITGADFYTAPINPDGTLINESEEWVSINTIDFEDLNDDTYVLQKNIYIDYEEFGSISENISLDGKNIDMNGHVVYGYNANSFYGQEDEDIKLNPDEDDNVNKYYLIDSFSDSIIENGAFIGTPFLFNNVVNSTLKNVYVSDINVNIDELFIGDNVENGLIINSIDENSILNGVSFVNNNIEIKQLNIESEIDSGDTSFRLSLIGDTNFTSSSNLNIIGNNLVVSGIAMSTDLFDLKNIDINVDFLGKMESSNFLLNILNNSISITYQSKVEEIEDIVQIILNADYYVDADKTYIDNIITSNSNSFIIQRHDEIDLIDSGLDEGINQDEINWNYKPIMPTIYDVAYYSDSESTNEAEKITDKLIPLVTQSPVSKMELDEAFKPIGNVMQIKGIFPNDISMSEVIEDINTQDLSHLSYDFFGNNLDQKVELDISNFIHAHAISEEWSEDDNEALLNTIIHNTFKSNIEFELNTNSDAITENYSINEDGSYTYTLAPTDELNQIIVGSDTIYVGKQTSLKDVFDQGMEYYQNNNTKVSFDYKNNQMIIDGLPFFDYKNLIHEVVFKVTIDGNVEEVTHTLNPQEILINPREDSAIQTTEKDGSLIFNLENTKFNLNKDTIESIEISEITYHEFVDPTGDPNDSADDLPTTDLNIVLNHDVLGDNWGIPIGNISLQSSSYQYIIVSSMAVFVILLIVLIFVLIIKRTYTNKVAYESDDYIYDVELSEDEQDQLEN